MFNDEPVHRIHVPEPTPTKKVGAVLIFESTDVERIQAFLDRCAERGIIAPATARGNT